MKKSTSTLKTAAQLLNSLPALKQLIRQCNDIQEADKLVKRAFQLINPDSQLHLHFKVVNVTTKGITIGCPNSVVWSRLHYMGYDFTQQIGRQIFCRIIHYDGKTLIDPRQTEL